MTALSRKETPTGMSLNRDAPGMLQGLFLHADMEVYTASLFMSATLSSYCTFQLSEMSENPFPSSPRGLHQAKRREYAHLQH